MGDQERLHELERRFVLGCRSWYLLRLWERHRSFESSTVADRIQVAEEVLATDGRGGVTWAQGGWLYLIAHLIGRLNDDDPHIRGEAAIALGDLEQENGRAVPVLLERVHSPQVTPHDRACAAWALGRIGRGRNDVVPVLLKVLGQFGGAIDAEELRRCAAEAIESLTDDDNTLFEVARYCLADAYYKCNLIGLGLIQRRGEQKDDLLPLVERLVMNPVQPVAVKARHILTG